MRIALVAPLVTAIAQPYLGGAQALLADLAQPGLRKNHALGLKRAIPRQGIGQVVILPAGFAIDQ